MADINDTQPEEADIDNNETPDDAEPVTSEQPEPVEESAPEEETPDNPKKSLKQKLQDLTHLHYALIVAVLIIFALLGVLLFVLSSDDAEDTANVSNNESSEVVEEGLSDDEIHSEDGTNETNEVAGGEALVAGAVTWLSSPQLVDDLPLFSAEAINAFYAEKNAEYSYDIRESRAGTDIESYKLGETTAQEIYLEKVLIGSGLGDIDALFFVVKDKASGQLTATKWLSKNVSTESDTDLGVPVFESGITVSDNGYIPELDYPESISYSGVTAERTSSWYVPGLALSGEKLTRLKDEEGDKYEQVIEGTKLEGAVLYEVVRSLSNYDGIKTVELVLELPNGFRVQYRHITSLMRDDNSIPITWTNDNATTEDVYRWDLVWAGCGAVNQPLVLDKQYHKDLEVVGTSNGQDIFWLNRSSHPAVEALFTASSASLGDNAITQSEFFNDRPAIVVRNDLGYYLILNNEKYQRAAECAKPVIYLYPEAPTMIEVQVGADVTVSDPYYGDGWEAIALPDGTLMTASGTYNSLFWDGYGHGPYPEITKGNFVLRKDIKERLTADLAYMGLNQTEIADFLEYWMPLMPDTTYVRLTWFNTQEMDRLAPLTLNFTPDSTIRVFLDYEGVDAPYDLPAQSLPSYERSGFTLVEWGGLRTGR